MEIAGVSHRPERFHTGVPSLDLVLGDGLLRGTIVMVIGPPGKKVQRVAPVPGFEDLMPALLERGDEKLSDGFFIVDNQNQRHHAPEPDRADQTCASAATGRATPVNNPTAGGAGPASSMPAPSRIVYTRSVRSKSERRIFSTANTR